MRPPEIIFEASEPLGGGYHAWAPGQSVFTKGDERADLEAKLNDVVRCRFDEDELPRVMRLHFMREEVIAI